MIDITHKYSTLRMAVAEATVHFGDSNTSARIKEKSVPKGDVLEMARTAGLLGIKQTAHLIPDCHPLPIEETKIDFEVNDQSVRIIVNCKTIYKTGVEVEAMHGASIVALTMYDMLKPIDKGIEIKTIRLLEKSGGKSSFPKEARKPLSIGLIICSNAVNRGDKKANGAEYIKEYLKELGSPVTEEVIIPEQEEELHKCVDKYVSSKHDLIMVVGSTGITNKDIANKVLESMIETPAPGIIEAARMYGLQRSPFAMLSNGSAGFVNESFLLSLPGSSDGAKDSIHALFPFLFHILGRFK